MTVRFFYNLEFLDNGHEIQPISIGIVTNEHPERAYYAVNDATDQGALYHQIRRHDWLMLNVVPHLPLDGPVRFSPADTSEPIYRFDLDRNHPDVKSWDQVAQELRQFIDATDPAQPIELWGYYAAYDHVALMQTFGAMFNRPLRLPMYTNDLMQVDPSDLGSILPPTGTAHNALDDARWHRAMWRLANGYPQDELWTPNPPPIRGTR